MKRQLPQQFCNKHCKSLSILLVDQAKYICEDCAVFDQAYKHQHMMENQSLTQQITIIFERCSGLIKQAKKIEETGLSKMNSLMRTIQHSQVAMVNKVNSLFTEVKNKVSQHYMQAIEMNNEKDILNYKAKILEIKKEESQEFKIMKYYQYRNIFQEYEKEMRIQMERTLEVFEAMKDNIETNVEIKVDIMPTFQSVFRILPNKNRKPVKQIIQTESDEDLLDFSEYTIPKNKGLKLISNISEPKEDFIGRRKTAVCLEDSIYSTESLCQSIKTEAMTIANGSLIKDEKKNTQSILSDRSISCSSAVSNYQSGSQLHNSTKESSKKTTIQISSIQELTAKVLSIPPTIKSIKLINLSISVQQLSQILKQKISRSFVTSIEIVNCPKLNEKMLMEIKNHRCKTLKKVEIRDCKEMNWGDKRVKEMVKKLESQGIKVVY